MTSTDQRREPGTVISPLKLETLRHGTVPVPGSGLTHLMFRRFSGCPICNLHLMKFRVAYPQIARANITVVAFFHSSATSMEKYQGDLPFPAVADPEREHYRAFGVERSWGAMSRIKTLLTAAQGMTQARANPFAGGMDKMGLPADFLVNSQGLILESKYGSHADDQWSVEDLLQFSSHVAPAAQ